MSYQIALLFVSHGVTFDARKHHLQLFVSSKFSLSGSFGVTERGDSYNA